LELHADEFFSAGTPTRRNKSRARRLGATPIRSGRSCPSSGGGGRWVGHGGWALSSLCINTICFTTITCPKPFMIYPSSAPHLYFQSTAGLLNEYVQCNVRTTFE
jgi:hypothetical protein